MASPALHHPPTCSACGSSRISASGWPRPSCSPASRYQGLRHEAQVLTRASAAVGSQHRSVGSFPFRPSGQPNAALSSDWAPDFSPFSVQASSGATAQRPPDTDVMGLLLRQRIVFLGFNLDEYAADAIISQLLLLDAQDSTKDIRLFINCPGGATSAAMAVYDAIQLCRADISTIAFGIAASTAAIVLAGGTKGKRFAMPNTRIMLHQPLAGASGQVIDVEIQAREAMHHRKNVARILSGITGRAIEQVEKDIDRDRYMSPAEAMEYGVLDGVIDKDMIIPLSPSPERVLQSRGYRSAEKNPRKFLNPIVSDDDIN